MSAMSTVLTSFMNIAAFLLLAVLCVPVPAHAEGVSEETDVQGIIEHVDRLYRSGASYSEVEMQVVSEHWQRTLRMNIWTRGMDMTFIRITSPARERGMATLRTGREMWNYFPKINKVMKVPPSMMMGSWMGSDFTNDDLVKESSLLRDYHVRLLPDGGADGETISLELTPKEDTATVWGRIVITVQGEDYLPVKEIYFDEHGREMRVLTFSGVRSFGDRRLPAVLEMRPLNKKGRSTVVRYKELRFDTDFGGDVFTLRNLKSRR